jgi:transcriptional regulator with XRE-family HTH domain
MGNCSEILCDLRKDKGLHQKDIAKLIETTQQQYSKYETGDTEISARALEILADFYNTSTDYILGRTNRKEGIVISSEMITGKYSAGEIISDIAMLTPERRSTVVDFVTFLKFREQAEKNGKKDGE